MVKNSINTSVRAFDFPTPYRLWMANLPKEYRDCIGPDEFLEVLIKLNCATKFYAHKYAKENLRCKLIKVPKIEDIQKTYFALLPWYARWYCRGVLLGHLSKTTHLPSPCKT